MWKLAKSINLTHVEPGKINKSDTLGKSINLTHVETGKINKSDARGNWQNQ